MNFTAPAFVLLFPIVLALHWMLPPSRRWVLLLAASLGFYAVGNPQALPLLAGITLGTYAAALGIAKSKTQTAKKLWLTCAAILCIGCLCLFKYAGIFRTDVPLLLPAGISFYTFQTLSYVIDIYRGRLMPERHPGYYALFVSFFPQLVAGPIERSTALLPQLHAPERRMDSSGWLWMVRGFAKKLLLADTAAVFVDSVYASPADASGPAVLLATLLFAGQIYWDFSGYSDIAIGAAALLGVRLSRNFDHPYRADSLRDFWRRWHISLTRWFTDYVYIPLGGSRCGTARLAVNTMVVFLLSGLWHGAKISFVVWGGLNGLYQIIGEILQPLRDKLVKLFRLNRNSIGHKAIHIIVTFVLIDFTWIFFRANSFSEALTILSQIIHVHNPWILFDGSLYNCGLNSKNFCFMLLCILLLFVTDYLKQKKICIREIVARQDAWCQVLIIAFSVVFILVFGIYGTSYDASKFIYFQF